MHTESLDNKKVITPNKRMAEQLTQSMAKSAMSESGCNVVSKSDVSSLFSFIAETFKLLRFTPGYETLPPLVDSSYVFVCFIKAINANKPDVIIDPSELASTASSAYSNMKMWDLETFTPENLDHEYFISWSNMVERELSKLNVSLEWDALDAIIAATLKGDLTFSKPIALFGFDDYPPKVKSFIETLSLMGVDISYPWYEDVVSVCVVLSTF